MAVRSDPISLWLNRVCRNQGRQITEPKASALHPRVAVFIRLDSLSGPWKIEHGKLGRVFDCNPGAIRRQKAQEKHSGFQPIHKSGKIFDRMVFIKQSNSPNRRQERARRVRYQQVPRAVLCVCVCVHRLERAVPVDKGQAVAQDMPFRVAPGAGLNISRKRSVTTLPERLADSLRFFASKY